MAQTIFKRCEKKFLLTEGQYQAVKPLIERYILPDRFTNYPISNIYLDTRNFDLIRLSLGKPKYKEKLRVRFYGTAAGEDSRVFVEIKKKFDGVVYKRRVEMSLEEARDYLEGDIYPAKDSQILREIDYMKNRYGLRAKAFIAYDREAYSGRKDPELRVTFDRRIRCRDSCLDFTAGDGGEELLEPGLVLMEVKIPGAMPLWMSREFSRQDIFMTTYSKYGTYYTRCLMPRGYAVSCPAAAVAGAAVTERRKGMQYA